MRMHALQTGTVAIKQRQRHGQGRGGMRLLNTLLDRDWTEPLPIYAWLIEHPEGIIVVDTGSRDGTREVAKKFAARLFEFAWCDDFSAARNYSLEQATGDWPAATSRAFCVLKARDPEALSKVLTAINAAGADTRVITGAEVEGFQERG